MILSYREYSDFNEMDVRSKIRQKKQVKYFSPETAAVISELADLFAAHEIALDTPFYFALCKRVFPDKLPDTFNEKEVQKHTNYEDAIKMAFDYGIELETMNETGAREMIREKVLHSGKFSSEKFSQNIISELSPIDQFKTISNMAVSFVSIVFDMHGDNVTVYESSRALLFHAITSVKERVLIGAVQARWDGKIRTGLALASPEELSRSRYLTEDVAAIEMFSNWQAQGFH